MNLIALRNFSGPDGKHAIGDVFEAKDEVRAKFLIDDGYAKRATKADEKAAEEGAQPPSTAPKTAKAPT